MPNFINVCIQYNSMFIQKRYIKLKLRKPTARKEILLAKTLEKFKGCMNMWLEELKEFNGEYPTMGKLHNIGYKDVRTKYPELHSNVVQEAMNRSLGIYRTWRKVKGEKKYPIYKENTMSFKSVDVKIESNFISVPLLNKERMWLPLIIPQKFKKYMKLERGNVIFKREKDDWFSYIALKVPLKEPYKPKGFIGADLGINNLLTLSNGKFFDGKSVKKYRKRMLETKRKLQSGKSRLNNKSRKLSQLRRKESRFTDYINHKIAKEVVLIAKQKHYGLGIENLVGLVKGMHKNQRE